MENVPSRLPYKQPLKLRAQNFYEVIVNKGEARVNFRFKEIESE